MGLKQELISKVTSVRLRYCFSECYISFQLLCSLMGQNGVEDEVRKFRVLPACDDEHGGVIVDMKEPMGPTVFQAMLKASLSQWKLEVCDFLLDFQLCLCLFSFPSCNQQDNLVENNFILGYY